MKQRTMKRAASALAGFARLMDELRSHAVHESAADLVNTVIEKTGYGAQIAASTTDEVLRDVLGRSGDEIAALRARGVV